MIRNKLSTLILITIQLFASLQAQDTSISDIDPKSELCLNFFKNLTSSSYDGPNVTAQVSNFLQLSGHNLNDLGDYSTCKSLSGQKYTVMTLTANAGKSYSVGICGPKYCNMSELQTHSSTVAQLIANETGRDLEDYTIAFVDPEATKPRNGFWLYLTSAIFIVLISMAAAGTVLANKKRPKENQEDNQTSLLSQKNNSPSKWIKVLECFDLGKNLKDIFKNEENPNHDQNINVLNGLRTFAFFSVIYGHTFSHTLSKIKNFSYIPIYMKSAWLLTVFGALYAVDTFFYIGGFLTGFLMLSKLRKMPMNKSSYFQILFHRWIRLWPAYLMAILFYWKISVRMGSGPLWNNYIELAENCSWSSWMNLLFIDNLLAGQNPCFGWGWYLACDFQVFLIMPFICWTYIRNKKQGRTAILALLAISVTASYLYSLKTGVYFFPQAILDGTNIIPYMLSAYPSPIVRMSTCLVGLWLGILFKEYKEGQKNFFTWIQERGCAGLISFFSGVGLLSLVFFYPRTLQTGDPWSPVFAMTWNTFGRILWVLGLFLLTAPCLVGNLKPVRWVLGSYIFNLVTKVSYGGYLLHLVFLDMTVYGSTELFTLSQGEETILTLFVFAMACGGSIVLQVLIEKPIINLEASMLLQKRKAQEETKCFLLDKEKNDQHLSELNNN